MKFIAVHFGIRVITSPSPRRAWIEMRCIPRITFIGWVALPSEGVD